jgi:hypothetical protein
MAALVASYRGDNTQVRKRDSARPCLQLQTHAKGAPILRPDWILAPPSIPVAAAELVHLRENDSDFTIHGYKVSAYCVGAAVLGLALMLYLLIDAYVIWKRERRLLKWIRRNKDNGK